LLVVGLLSLVTGLVLAGAFDALTASPRLMASSAGEEELAVVRQFYDVVNTTLATGEVQPLNAVIARDLVEHPARTGRSSGRAGFAEALIDLRRTYPDLHLIPGEIAAVGGVVTARVTAGGTSGARFLNFPLAGRDAWGALDVFRVAGGRVVEHWGATPEAIVPAAPAETTVALPPPRWRVLELVRLTFAPGQEATYEGKLAPLLISGESESVTVSLDPDCAGPATLITAALGDRHPVRGAVPPGERVTLVAGDLLIPAIGGCATVRNDDVTPARVLILKAPVPAVPGGAGWLKPPLADATAPLAQTVAGGVATTLPEAEATVGVGRVTLGPGADFPARTAAGPELIVVESGRLALTATGGTVWVRRAPDGLTNKATQVEIGAGDALLVPAGVTAGYRAAGDDPVALLIVTLAPVSSPRTAESAFQYHLTPVRRAFGAHPKPLPPCHLRYPNRAGARW
jgi:quercetin dioxygenase-like cupin family protein/predicted SnoaL-like aldol condensation-catalyzing enzyme